MPVEPGSVMLRAAATATAASYELSAGHGSWVNGGVRQHFHPGGGS